MIADVFSPQSAISLLTFVMEENRPVRIQPFDVAEHE